MQIDNKAYVMVEISVNNSVIEVGNIAILEDLNSEISIREGRKGVFLTFNAVEECSVYKFKLGSPIGTERFMCSNRPNMFWLTTECGDDIGKIPGETQFLLTKQKSGGYVLYVPLVSNPYRSTLKGESAGLELCAETGSQKVSAKKVDVCYVAYGERIEELLHLGFKDISERYDTFRLRNDKMVPEIVDYFGWCTWDAFYKAVSEDKMMSSLNALQELGVTLGFIVLDDGWQQMMYNAQPDWAIPDNVWKDRLTGFGTNDKFSEGLGGVIQAAKEKLGVNKFYVWHSLNGYWAGVDKESMPEFDIKMVQTEFSENLRDRMGNEALDFWDVEYGLVPPEQIARFYNQYHNQLRKQGVDGVKVDAQARLEGLGKDYGGRVNLMEKYHQALEGSVHVHFNGELINCMSCSNDVIFNTLNSSLIRSSDDFYPTIPDSHGRHIRDNAYTSLWLGEVMHPDWDMFKSSHEMGEFHAAARAISGGPVYVSDKVEEFNLELIKRLVLSNGAVPRCTGIGRPTDDCLFFDPCQEDVLLKIYNKNVLGGIIGVFQCQYHECEQDRKKIEGVVRPSDIVGLKSGNYAMFSAKTGKLQKCSYNDSIAIAFEEGEYDLFTFIPIENGFAPIGLTDKMNTAGCIDSISWETSDKCILKVKDGGMFTAYAERRIIGVSCNGENIDFTDNDGKISISLTSMGSQELCFSFA